MLFGRCTVACGLAAFCSLATGTVIPRYFQTEPISRRDLPLGTIQMELGSMLSKHAAIFGPSDPRWEMATERYSTHAIPRVQVVTQPGVESDIPKIVKYCNENSIEFMVVNQAHARAYSVGNFDGMEIDMALLRDIKIQPDKKSAWFQGGTFDGQVIDYLWDRGFITMTGSCSCVGMMGPGLGGGHGRLEGYYGLISDNLININLVLADGSAIQVNETSYPDLLWGIKGAGHNFGIVTSFELKIYPHGAPLWHYHNYIWTQDRLETVFEELNNLHKNGSTPLPMAVEFGYFTFNSTISQTEPVISWTFGYRGTARDAEKLLAPFNKIGAAWDESGDVPYSQIPDVQGTGLNGPLCVNNMTHITSTANLQVFNVTIERQIYETYVKWVKKYPEFNTAEITHEGYSNKAIRNFNPDDSAFPSRYDNHLVLFDMVIPHGSNLREPAQAFADEVRDLWNAGQPTRPPTAYVNYANGFEGVTEIYGPEAWRLEKLRGLKAKYDPHNRFRFYIPIITN
ncbi:hypothetical protein GGR58DRAFT_523389 [Xylaria digitata]|nr:hypothetical protein GGR58DRAFT_523389 [Xylaria digitata]